MKTQTNEKELPTPIQGAVFYDDPKIYACLANYPIAPGHSIVVWKEKVADLHLLKPDEYQKLMDVVDSVRNALLIALDTDKVYLLYMDEVEHVHWHLVPRSNGGEGMTLLEHEPKELKDFTLSEKLKNTLRSL